MGISEVESKSISLIRLISMVLIITCHILQGLGSWLAFWLNVGVQIFLFMSGYLFGRKNIVNIKTWYIKRITKIMIPYYVFLFSILALYFFWAKELLISNQIVVNLLCLQGFKPGLDGIQHLWFVTYILSCYLITPLLQKLYLCELNAKKLKLKIFLVLLIFLLINLFINLNSSYLACYIIGYYSSRMCCNKDDCNKYYMSNVRKYFILFSLTFIIYIILSNYFKGLKFLRLNVVQFIYDWNHAFLGILLFYTMILSFRLIFERRSIDKNYFINSLLNQSNKYSYCVYIFHQIIILGKFSLVFITPILFLNIFIIIICALVGGIILQKFQLPISNKITKKILNVI